MNRKIYIPARTTRLLLRAGIVVATMLLVAIPGPRAQCTEDDQVHDCVGTSCTVEVFVKIEDTGSIDAVLANHPEFSLKDSLEELKFYIVETVVEIPPGSEVEEVVEGIVNPLENEEDVAKAEPLRNLETPEGVQLSIPDLGIVADVQDFNNQPAAVTIATTTAQARYTGAGVTIAVIDTGMAFDHPVTSSIIQAPGVDFAGGDGTAGSQPNGENDDDDGLVDESLHHATYVTGLIKLVAPDASIIPIRSLETDGKGTTFGVARGILHAVAVGADVINLSNGMLHESRAIEEAIEIANAAGVIVVAAAGNRGWQIVQEEVNDCESFPANMAEVIAVAAVDGNLVKTEFSDYGEDVDLSAPGLDLISTFGSSEFAGWSGTSFAAPQVAGAVALILEKYPCLTPADVRTLLVTTTQPDNNPPIYDGLMGSGVLDLDALTLALAADRCSLEAQETPQGTVLSWSPVKDALSYDVVRGSVQNLTVIAGTIAPREIDLGPLTCIANNLSATDTTAAADAATPDPGESFYYLFRDDVAGGSYGAGIYPRTTAGVGDCSLP